MTWYDHETGSIWTQPWGRALTGEMKGTQLQIVPFSLVPWKTWRAEHPDTLALKTEGVSFSRPEQARNGFVAGVAIGEAARAYPYLDLADAVVVEDVLGGVPLVIHTNPNTKSIHMYISRLSDGTLLSFVGDAETLTDLETGSMWDPVRGLAVEGELAGQALRQIPYISAFDWAWFDFYPHSDLYVASDGE